MRAGCGRKNALLVRALLAFSRQTEPAPTAPMGSTKEGLPQYARLLRHPELVVREHSQGVDIPTEGAPVAHLRASLQVEFRAELQKLGNVPARAALRAQPPPHHRQHHIQHPIRRPVPQDPKRPERLGEARQVSAARLCEELEGLIGGNIPQTNTPPPGQFRERRRTAPNPGGGSPNVRRTSPNLPERSARFGKVREGSANVR